MIADYDVSDLIEELKEWVDEGFVEADIWSKLGKRINPSILPTDVDNTEEVKEIHARIEPVVAPFSQTGIKHLLIDNFQ